MAFVYGSDLAKPAGVPAAEWRSWWQEAWKTEAERRVNGGNLPVQEKWDEFQQELEAAGRAVLKQAIDTLRARGEEEEAQAVEKRLKAKGSKGSCARVTRVTSMGPGKGRGPGAVGDHCRRWGRLSRAAQLAAKAGGCTEAEWRELRRLLQRLHLQDAEAAQAEAVRIRRQLERHEEQEKKARLKRWEDKMKTQKGVSEWLKSKKTGRGL